MFVVITSDGAVSTGFSRERERERELGDFN